MILVQTTIPVDPSYRQEALELFSAIIEQSRTEEGVIDYWAATDIDQPNVVRFFERYEDEAALERHTETDHYDELTNSLPQLADGQLRTIQFETAGSPESVRFDAEDAA